MTVAVRQILDTYDTLSPDDRHTVVVEILRRSSDRDGDLPEDALLSTVDELFLALDNEEKSNGQN